VGDCRCAAGVARLFRALAEHDRATACHALRVRRYALALADAWGLDAGARQQLLLAARLHDVGKVGLPRSLLDKPGPLTAGEYRLVCEHAALGERLLRPVLHSPAVLAVVRGHHERPDGAGYPDRLRGSAIPWLARALAVVDCFDAMTSPRPYRRALTRAEATEQLRLAAGSQLDRAVVECFLAALDAAGRRPGAFPSAGRALW
jgi:HD-GYP domain-containing protein (c-di-GMP phosphodiesterase class II)